MKDDPALRILFADDDEFFRLLYVPLLRRELGDVVDEVGDGARLLDLASKKKGAYGLIVTDNDMPGYSGLEAVELIRGFDALTPIYLVSGGDVRSRALRAGASDFSRKPVPSAEFLRRCVDLYHEGCRDGLQCG